MEIEPWKQYGGIYRMVNFGRDWTYTPIAETSSLPSIPTVTSNAYGFPGASIIDTVTPLSSQSNNGVQGLGLELEVESPVTIRQPAPPDSAATSISCTDPTSSSKPAFQLNANKRFGFVKKWFTSVRGNFRRRKETAASICYEETVSPPPPPPLLPLPLQLQPSLQPSIPLSLPPSSASSSVNETLEEHKEEKEERVIPDWHAPLALWEWKAWGYYARPWINGVWVTNYPPSHHVPADADVVEIADSLVDPDESEHPERWIAGLEHPSLPPRPLRWYGDPQPYRPWQCQLNPYLRRTAVGVPPLFWDMGTTPDAAVHGHSLIATPLLPPDRVQPATWPMTTEFRISALADDVELAWPILIRKKTGVTVQDVLEWIYINFQEYISRDEWEKWPMYLREMAVISYDKRRGVDGVKRIDYLGFHSMFRGFEQSPDGDSWYLFVGRPW